MPLSLMPSICFIEAHFQRCVVVFFISYYSRQIDYYQKIRKKKQDGVRCFGISDVYYNEYRKDSSEMRFKTATQLRS